ncbi:MAG: hypothetical protein WAW02_16220 [Sideroxyarcus sp.]
MSWDISIMKFSHSYESVAEIPEDEKPLLLGPRSSVHESVLKTFPGTNWADPAWGVWESEAGSIEFNLGSDDPAEGIMLHVRAGIEVVPLIASLCISNGWQGVDCSSGDFIEKSATPEAGLEAWSSYRDQVVGGYN